VTRNRHRAWLQWVMKLSMAAFLSNLCPSIAFHDSDRVPHLHATSLPVLHCVQVDSFADGAQFK
jgi:hypothetical protein